MDLLFRPEPIAWIQRFIGLGQPEPFLILGELGTSWGILVAASLALWIFGRRTLLPSVPISTIVGFRVM